MSVITWIFTAGILAIFVPTVDLVIQFRLSGIFSDNPPPDAVRLSFRQSLLRHNIYSNSSEKNFTVMGFLETANLNNSVEIMSKMCSSYNRNVLIQTGQLGLRTLNAVISTSETLNIPYLTPSVSLHELYPDISAKFMISMKPSLLQPLIDLITYLNWNDLLYLFDTQEGYLRFMTLHRILLRSGFDVGHTRIQSMDPAAMTVILQTARKNNLHHVVCDTSVETAKLVLLKATELQMVTASYHYIFMDLDIGEMEIADPLWGLNISGFRLVDKDGDPYVDFIAGWRSAITNDTYAEVEDLYRSAPAMTLDMMAVSLQALNMMRLDKFVPPIDKKTRTCMDPELRPYRYGRRILDYIKRVNMTGLTGRIMFDEKGERTNYSLEVLGLRADTDGYVRLNKVGSWYSSRPNRIIMEPVISDEGEPDPSPSLRRTWVITSILESPFVMLRTGGNFTGNKRYEGFIMDMLNEIKQTKDFSDFEYDIQIVSDNKYGGHDQNGRWQGMIGELVYGNADIAAAPLTINAKRERVISFTKPYMTTGVSIMVKKSAVEEPSVFSFMLPLAKEIWMSIVFAWVGVSVALFQVSRFSIQEWHLDDDQPLLNSAKESERDEYELANQKTNDFGIFNSFWFSLGALMQQGVEICPRSTSGRIIGGVWWLFTLIIVSSYTANLAAFLVNARMDSPIGSAEDLVERTDLTYGVRKGGSTMTFFSASTLPVYRKMFQFMENRDPSPYANTTREGIQRVRKSGGKYLFLLESVMNDYENTQQPCDTARVGENLESHGYGLGVNKHLTELREKLTLAILKLNEDAVLDKLRDRWWDKRSQCPVVTEKKEAHQLTMSSVAGIFYILLGGLSLAVIAAASELTVRRYKKYNIKVKVIRGRPEGSEMKTAGEQTVV
ncbi:glutamate receptor 1-like [Amphiura filiformis]|uniref:glutamate receptor 1-like n=1 Tax=Amphiura filiformis TaxID=82378 RepID=UPI003B20FC2F